MPTIIPSYLYSIFAALLVGAIVVYACSLSTINVKNEALNEQLTKVNEYVAIESLRIITHTEENQNTTQALELPTQIGNQPYWIRIANDSSGAWVESGYGTDTSQGEIQVAIPAEVIALGNFTSASGRGMLSCHLENKVPILTLTGSN